MEREKDSEVDNCLLTAHSFVDKRGELCFAEANKDIPFPISRIFWISNVPEGAERGGHAHWKCDEAIFPVVGGFDILLDDGNHQVLYSLNASTQGVWVKAGVWCVLRNFKPGTVCLVAASTPYDKWGYEHNYQSFLEKTKCKH